MLKAESQTVSDQILIGYDENANPVRITSQDRTRHMHVVGASGMGKSYFLQSMIQQDIEQGKGLCVIDPHGELYDNLVRFCASKPELRRRVVLFNPSDSTGFIPGFNPLARTSYYPKISVQVDRFIDVIRKVMSQEDAVQPQLEETLRNVLLPIIKGGYSLLEVERFFNYEESEKLLYLASKAEDEKVMVFWRNFLKERDKETKIGSFKRRAARFIYSDVIRLLIGETKRTFDFQEIIEDKKVLLVNLGTKGNIISPENSQLLGVMLVNELTAYGMARNVASAKKRPFYVYIDEFQDYVTSDIAKLLTGGRKFGLNLVLAHQEQSQIEDERVRDAVLAANIQMVFGGTSAATAEEMAENTTGLFHDLFAVKYMDERTYFKPVLRKEIVRGQTDSTTHTDTSGKSQNSSRGDRSGSSYDRNKHHSTTTSDQTMSQSGSGESQQHSNANARSESEQETFVTDHEERKEQSPRFFGLNELDYMAKTALIKLPQRQAVAQKGKSDMPLLIRTLDVQIPKVSKKELLDFKEMVYRTHGCYSLAAKVERRIVKRSEELDNFYEEEGSIKGIATGDDNPFTM